MTSTAGKLIARLKPIRDARSRVLVLVEALNDDPARWADALAAVVDRAQALDDADANEVVETIIHAAADPALSYATRQALYEAAVEAGHTAIARLFLATSPPEPTTRQLVPERPLKPNGRPLSLGERKALARTHHRDQLLLLIRDPHPAVVAILLENPHVTETDVVRIAAARPANPTSLAAIAAHARWSVRLAVKRALVLNPATPLGDAIRIATTLRPQLLLELAADPSLPEPLRRHAAEIAARSRDPDA